MELPLFEMYVYIFNIYIHIEISWLRKKNYYEFSMLQLSLLSNGLIADE